MSNQIKLLSPRSCDTFVVLPPFTRNSVVIFGKNSDRPQNEVQEVILSKDRTRESKLKCTYITIDESTEPINSVILSKPAWMWGAEMGANEKNVVIGNEAVWTNHNEGDGDARQKRLLGMDLVRLGLERGDTAAGALDIITSLLEKYGQGGPCSESDDSHFYHNSFLIADTKEAWVLETSGKLWAAERITSGYRNISNGLTIGTKMDKHSDQLPEIAESMGLWDGKVSSLSPEGISVHWFTATPDPSVSYFKPFIFTPNANISSFTESPNERKREHKLYELHSKHVVKSNNVRITKILQDMEQGCLADIERFIGGHAKRERTLDELDDLMKNCVDTEVKLYS